MMGQDVTVLARCTKRTRNLVDVTPGEEYLEVSIHGPQRERRHLRQQGLVDLGGGRMRIGLLNPAPDTISLARAVATRGCRIILGGSSHVRIIEAREALGQVKIENSSEFWDTPTPTPNSDCRMAATMTRDGDRKNAAERLGTCAVGTRASTSRYARRLRHDTRGTPGPESRAVARTARVLECRHISRDDGHR